MVIFMQALLTLLMFFGMGIFIFLYITKNRLLEVKWEIVAKFLAYMFLIAMVKFAVPSQYVDNTSVTSHLFVFWEDVIFSMSIYYIKDVLKQPKKIWIPFAVFSSLLFGYYHLGYGVIWALITVLYPYYFSYKNAVKYGFGTVMICHIYFDFIMSLSTKFSSLLYNLGYLK